MVDRNSFRAYDIRGTYPDQLNVDVAFLIGKAFASFLHHKKGLQAPSIVVGRDARTHSKELQQSFIRGLLESGCKVKNLGLAASPYLYFANTFGKFDAGCNITASHNPKQYNGFKLMTKDAHAVFGDEIQNIYDLIQAENFIDGRGELGKADYQDEYFKKIESLFNFKKSLKVVVDTGNGIAGAFYPSILRKLGHEVVELYTELDGTFPNHEPDPIVEDNLTDLKYKVVEEKADLGFAFDGDGDRCAMVTEKGEFIDADKILILLSKDALSRHQGGAVVFTVSNSQVLFELVEQWGGKPIMAKVGHSYVEHAMTEHKAILGGEQSGHFFLPEGYYQYDDALVTACRLLKIFSDDEKPASALFHEFPKTFAEPEIRPYCPDEAKFEIIAKVTEHFESKYDCNTLDGVRIDFGDGGWAGIRVSNTSPKISITMEAKTQAALDTIKSEVLTHLKGYPEIKW